MATPRLARTDHASRARTRGRPQRLPDDPTPLTSVRIACEPRVGWLLATNRMYCADPGVARRDGFIDRLVQEGLRVDGPRLSRWESGTSPVSPSVLATYERVLDLPDSSLVSTVSQMRRAFGEPSVGSGGGDPRRRDDEVEELIERAVSGNADGSHWLALATELSRYGRVFLPSPWWTGLATRLIGELALAGGLDYLRRYEAASTLLGCDAAARHLLLAVGEFVLDPDAQVIAPVLNLLTEVADEQAGDLVLRLLRSGGRHLHLAASSVAAVKLARGHFAQGAADTLEQQVLQDLGRGASFDGGLDQLDLAAQLPATSWGKVESDLRDPQTRALVSRLRSDQELVAPGHADRVARQAADAVQAEFGDTGPGESDLMLRRLLRESLLHVHKARRRHAGVVLAASPYAAGVARHCEQLARGGDQLVAPRALAVLMRIDHPGPGPTLLQLALREPNSAVRTRAQLNLGLRRAPLPSDVEDGLADKVAALPGQERRTALFALGMVGSDRVRSLESHPDPAVHRAAAWWSARVRPEPR